MDDATILELGGFCTELLSSEAFAALTAMYSQQCATDILKTDPKAVKEREGIYAAYQGFSEFLALTQKFSVAHTKLIEKQNAAETTPVDDFDHEGVHDIYRNDND
jgi:nucleoside 2-deoxyribosyltransferase